MQKREKILAAITGLLLLALIVVYLFSGSGPADSLGELRQRRDDLQSEVTRKQAEADRLARKDYPMQLAAFEKRSLPANLDQADSLYQKWLRRLVFDRAKFPNATVDPKEVRSRTGSYRKLPFSVQGQATLSQLTDFLYGFYSANLLHKITLINANPVGDSQLLNLTIVIEALSLPNAQSVDKLSTEPAARLALAGLEDYRQAIVRRRMEQDRFVELGGLFASYVPYRPPPPDRPPPSNDDRPPEPPRFDEAKYTIVTATPAVDGRPEVWLIIRPTGKTLMLHEGDPFEVGPLKGTIVKIESIQRYVIVEVDGKQHTLKLGDSLDKITEGSDEKA